MGIFLALVLIIAVLLYSPLRAYVEFDKSRLKVKVKYLWLKLYELDTSQKSSDDDGGKKGKTSADKDGTSASAENGTNKNTSSDSEAAGTHESRDDSAKKDEPDKPEEGVTRKKAFSKKDPDGKKPKSKVKNKTKPSLIERYNEIKPYIPTAKKGLRRLLKLIRLTRLELTMTVGGSDAYEAGMNFGRANQIFYPALAVVCVIFTVSIKKTQILCDFDNQTFDINGRTVVKVTPAAVLSLAVYLLINYFKIKKKIDKESKRETNNERKEQLS